MADKYIYNDTHATDIRAQIRTATSDPENPVAGDIYYNTQTNYLLRYSGSNWLGFLFTKV